MKKVLITLTLGLAFIVTHGQLYIGSDANSLVIKSGESFSYDGLTLTPSADLSLTNTTFTKTDANTISPAPTGTYITRYFSFANTTSAFSGTIRFSYSGASLNGLTAGTLRLNIRTNTAWTGGFGTDVGTGGGSYVEATSLSSTGLNTLTLAADGAALPVTWLKFTAEKKKNTSVLNWATATEQNTQDFLVQHSVMGIDWKTVGTVKAAGNTTTRKDYAFTHYTPATGYNYYRLIQRDQDEQFSYSKVATVLIDKDDIKLKVFPNPVQDGRLNVLLKEDGPVRIFDAAGRQVFSQIFAAGLQPVNISNLSNGVYIIKVNSESVRIILNR